MENSTVIIIVQFVVIVALAITLITTRNEDIKVWFTKFRQRRKARRVKRNQEEKQRLKELYSRLEGLETKAKTMKQPLTLISLYEEAGTDKFDFAVKDSSGVVFSFTDIPIGKFINDPCPTILTLSRGFANKLPGDTL